MICVNSLVGEVTGMTNGAWTSLQGVLVAVPVGVAVVAHAYVGHAAKKQAIAKRRRPERQNRVRCITVPHQYRKYEYQRLSRLHTAWFILTQLRTHASCEPNGVRLSRRRRGVAVGKSAGSAS